MDVGARTELWRGDRMVIVKPECGGWVVIRAGIGSFTEEGQCHGTETSQIQNERKRNPDSRTGVHSLTIKAAPFQIPFSIVSYLNNGPTINCRCGFVFAILKFRDLSVADIDAIDCNCELDVYGDTFGSVSGFCGA